MNPDNEINKLKKKVHVLEKKEKENYNFDKDKIYSDSLKYYERSFKKCESSNAFLKWFIGTFLAIIGIIVGYSAYLNFISANELKKEMQLVKFNSELGMAINKTTPEERIKALKNINTDNLSLENKLTLYFQLGYSFDANKKYAEAIRNYNRAIELKTYNERVINNKILSDYGKIIQLDKKIAIVYYNRGLLYSKQENENKIISDYDEAISDFTQAIKLDPNFPEAYYNRGFLYSHQADNNYNKAINDYSKAIKLKPDYAGAYNNRGVLYRKQGDKDKAFSDYNEAIRLDPNFADAYFNRGNFYLKNGDDDKAISDYTETIKSDNNYTDAYSNRGSLYFKNGDDDKAISDHTESIRLDPNSANHYNNRGEALLLSEKYQLALKDLVKYLELSKKNKFAIDITLKDYDGFKKNLEGMKNKNYLEQEVYKRLIAKDKGGFTIKKED